MDSDDPSANSVEALKAAEKARRLAEVEREFNKKFEKDWADLERLAAEYPHLVSLNRPSVEAASPLPSPPPETPRQMPAPKRDAGAPDANWTVATILNLYRADKRSGYSEKRYASRRHADSLARTLEEEFGDVLLFDITESEIRRRHQEWIDRSASEESDGVAMAHALITELKTAINFGGRTLHSSACVNLSFILRNIRFKHSKPKESVSLSLAQAKAIIAKAHELGFPSMALAQALQFECRLNQKDTIGEWVPQSEPGVSEVFEGSQKWLHGVRWSQIDDNFTLRHLMSRNQKPIEVDLTGCPLVLAELRIVPDAMRTGPMIVSERTGLPYHAASFRRFWRSVADDAGIPDNIKNMNSRSDGREQTDDSELQSNEPTQAEHDDWLFREAQRLAWREPVEKK
jgi:hypothetical protein